MTVAIIDYGSGNLHSARKAFERAACDVGISTTIKVTSDPDAVRHADQVVLPGVGAFADCARGLRALNGMTDALDEVVRCRGQPFLGICVGMQLMADRGLEYETVEGLGWIGGDVVLIEPGDPYLKIPHMGWNTLGAQNNHALLSDIPTGETGWHAYFVHSYQLKAKDPADVLAKTHHGAMITAMVARGNIAGTQFHPEKSQKFGLALIANFLRWRP
jgi:imidazole glycerol-phosphate synthase subunit HisH